MKPIETPRMRQMRQRFQAEGLIDAARTVVPTRYGDTKSSQPRIIGGARRLSKIKSAASTVASRVTIKIEPTDDIMDVARRASRVTAFDQDLASRSRSKASKTTTAIKSEPIKSAANKSKTMKKENKVKKKKKNKASTSARSSGLGAPQGGASSEAHVDEEHVDEEHVDEEDNTLSISIRFFTFSSM